MNYLPIIGLEVHVELKTRSKMFCGCDANYFGKRPNTQTCPVCLGLPGALPVPNKKAIDWCVMIGLALNCEIPFFSKFDRKNYFYPDLPKGYQISQYDKPFCVNGWINVKSQIQNPKTQINSKSNPPAGGQNSKQIRIRRVHMEEDTAKLMHQFGNPKSKIQNPNEEKNTLIDFNRSGVPLVEIVTEPDIHSITEAREYLQKLQRIIRHLGVSDCDMEKGSMRMEPNISLLKISNFKFPACAGRQISNEKKIISKLPDYKVEVKNINSFRFVEKAIAYEIIRQQAMLEKGEKITQETRGWNEARQMTVSQRSKEEAQDYRYFPEPDIPPITWKQEDVERIRKTMQESYEEVEKRYVEIFHLPAQYVSLATVSPSASAVFDEMVVAAKKLNLRLEPKTIADHVFNRKIDLEKIDAVEFVKQIAQQTTKKTMDVRRLKAIVKAVINQNAGLATDYKAGKTVVINVLIGMVMKKVKGQAQANEVRRLLLEAINKV